MSKTGSKIEPPALYITTGILLGIAAILATGRTYIRLHRDGRLLVDDGFFLLATATLLAGSVLLYLDIPLVYTQLNVSSGMIPPPDDFIQQLLASIKLQNAAVVLLTTTIFSVKLSFWFFFRDLLRRIRSLTIWWWCILPFLIIGAAFCIATNFISCPVFDESILEVCVTPNAVARQNAALKANAALDIVTDMFLISIPIFLLWRVHLTLRRKLALGATLCLSIFMIVIVIIKVSTGNIADGQVDSPWVLFWLHVEAAVAVVVVSITAFRVLFVHSDDTHSRKQLNRKRACQQGVVRTSPSCTKNGLVERDDSLGSLDMDFALEQSNVMATQGLSTRRIV